MSNTTEEFWKMVYEKDVAVIVMLSELVEDEKVRKLEYAPNEPASLNLEPLHWSLYWMNDVWNGVTDTKWIEKILKREYFNPYQDIL